MNLQYQIKSIPISDALISRLADEVRLEIQRRKNCAPKLSNLPVNNDLQMPIVLRGRSNISLGIFRSSRVAA